jgi:hypothetical protein
MNKEIILFQNLLQKRDARLPRSSRLGESRGLCPSNDIFGQEPFSKRCTRSNVMRHDGSAYMPSLACNWKFSRSARLVSDQYRNKLKLRLAPASYLGRRSERSAVISQSVFDTIPTMCNYHTDTPHIPSRCGYIRSHNATPTSKREDEVHIVASPTLWFGRTHVAHASVVGNVDPRRRLPVALAAVGVVK